MYCTIKTGPPPVPVGPGDDYIPVDATLPMGARGGTWRVSYDVPRRQCVLHLTVAVYFIYLFIYIFQRFFGVPLEGALGTTSGTRTTLWESLI